MCITSVALGVDRPSLPGLNRGGFRPSSFLSAGLDDESLLPAEPYTFSNDNVDEYGNKQFYKEQGDVNNVKTGSYGYTDANGIFRSVKYVADAEGFRAKVETNEPGTRAGTTADAVYDAKPIVVPPVIRPAGASVVPAYVKKNGPSLGRFPFGNSG
ncbi:hypothetical protein HPB47_013399 [Ixodes persulcatus]|uniref:Uncharacterized protein n=1 Tax=Ixodes persulcatus TaxID=34615 RepID=A0AC60R118_IXOPE|nr:hypothetical protein HPB47_013399 [Ixodes persulcatus]